MNEAEFASPSAAEFVSRLDGRGLRRETPCGDGSLVWRVWGAGPPLVLFHGGSGSWMHWVRNIDFLAGHFTLFVPDMPGFGDSAGGRFDGESTPEAIFAAVVGPLADGLRRLLPEGGMLDLCGFSFGGIIAGGVAAELAGRVRNLILVGAGGLGITPTLAEPMQRLGGSRDGAEAEAVLRRNLEIMMIADPRRIDALALHLHAINIRRTKLTRTRSVSRSTMLIEALGRMGPARLAGIWGAQDALAVSNLDARRTAIRRFRPDAPFKLIEKAGHWVQFEAAEAFNATLLRLLKA